MRRFHRDILPAGHSDAAGAIARQGGFTLLEMAIVLAIMGAIAGAALTLGSAKHESSKIDLTRERMAAIEEALKLHAYSAGYLPCPADATALPASSTYGTALNCSGVAPAGIDVAGTAGDTIWIGAIPTRTLNLPDSYMYDGWLNRFSYAAIAALATSPSNFKDYTTSANTGVIQILDYYGTQVTDASPDAIVAYAVISHGKDGKGAITRSGQIPTLCTAITIDDQNCNADAVFVDSRMTDSEIAARYYDDLVLWKTKNFLEPLKGEALSSIEPTFLYVTEAGNNRVQKFDSNGNFLMKFGSGGTGDGQFQAPKGIAVDSGGNIYVTDFSNHRVQKFDSEGNFLLKFGTSGSGDGQFNQPVSIAIDSVGNLYVADTGNNRVQKFDSNGNFLLKFGTPGNGNGQFNGAEGVAIDSGNNVYVLDQWNGRVQKFSSTGTYITQFGSWGSADGQFDQPEAVTVDQDDVVYVTDEGNQRIQIFDSNGVYLRKFYTTSLAIYLEDLAVDKNGYIYVLSEFDDHVVKFDSNGNYIMHFGSNGWGDGELNVPFGIEAAAQ